MVAITGATGLVGKELVKRFSNESIPCIGLVRTLKTNLAVSEIEYRQADLLDIPSLMKAFAGATTVIHTAALVSFNPKRNEEIYKVNVEGTRNVVNVCLALGIEHLIHVSSVAALGREKNILEIDESATWVESPLNTDYAKSKYEAELEVFRGQEEGLKISIVNPSVILAQSDWSKGSSSIFKYVFEEHKFYSAGTFNYVDVRDVTEMIFNLFSLKSSGKRYIANSGSIHSKLLFEKIASRFKKRPPTILANSFFISVATTIELLRSTLTGREPLVTKKTAKIASETFHYSNQKAINELNMKFKTLDETLDWCCSYYLANYTTNKH
jgi:nucleoside-diphosphate-sugar epimerase